MKTKLILCAITCAFVLVDFITGFVKARATNTFQSKYMREGLYHKIALVLCMALSILIDVAQAWLDLGISVPVTPVVCAYIVLMEVGSAVENLGKINPDIVPRVLLGIFGIDTKGDQEEDETHAHS